MNWHQLTGSSNSANDTPLHSYPASLSSQSSRDPSPASRFRNPVNSPPPTMPSQIQGSPTRHPTNDLPIHNTTHSKQEYVANSLNAGDHGYGSYPTQCRRTGESDTLQILGSLKETNSLSSKQTLESPSEMKQLRSQFMNSINHQSTVVSDSGLNRIGLIEQVNGPPVITNSRPTATFSPQSSTFPATLSTNQETTSSEMYQWGQAAKQLSGPTQQTSHPSRTQTNQQSPTQSIMNAQQQPLNHTSQLSSPPQEQISRLQGQSIQAETSQPGHQPASWLSKEGEHPPLSQISQRVQSPLSVVRQQPLNQCSYDSQLPPTTVSQNSPNRLPQLSQHFQQPSLQIGHQGHSLLAQTSLPQPINMIQTPLPQGSECDQREESSLHGLPSQRNYQGQPSLAQISHRCQPTPVKNIQLQSSQALNYQGQPPQTNQLSLTSQAPITQSQPHQNVSQRSTGQLTMQSQHAHYRGPKPALTAPNQHLRPILTSTSYQTLPTSTNQQVPPVSIGQVQSALSQIPPSHQSHLGQPSRPQMHGHRTLVQAQQSSQPQLNQFPPRPPSIPNLVQQPTPVVQPLHQYVNQQPINLPQLGTMQRPPLTGSNVNQIAQPSPPTVSNHYGPAVQQYSATSRYPQYPATTPTSPSYPTTARFAQQQSPAGGLASQMAGMNISQTGFNQLWGMDTFDLLKTRDILPPEKVEPPPIRLPQELYEAANCSSELFRCTLSKIPETKSLLDKSRLPLGVLIHPFKDLNELPEMLVSENIWPGSVPPQGDPYTELGSLPNSKHLSVIQCSVIVRCRNCRTYINPFVFFIDNKRWKCNLCFRANELPDEFQYDPTTKTYGDPSRRPEIKSATIEFIAPSEYMVRPPQAAAYVFVLDVSRLGCECGYLESFSRTLLQQLDSLPGDARTSVALITFDSTVHFYALALDLAQPHQIVLTDIDDMFLPCPDNLLVNLSECQDQIRELVQQLPEKFKESFDTHSALGAALQAAYRLLAPTGGRVTVFTSCLPNRGPGSLEPREDPSLRAAESVAHLNPLTDFYKKLALDCSGQQIAVDLFLVNSQYVDLATISGVSKFSGGCMHHFPLFQASNPLHVDNLETVFARYLTRKIGFESVMRLRCSRGLSIHTFHGNFFVRSTDLLSLPNINPDAGFGMQVSIDENLSDLKTVCFQAALLYTSSKGERRIRVHTICLPIASNLPDVLHSADQQCIVGLLAKMAVDRCTGSSLSDAREAFVNAAADILSAYRITQSSSCPTGPLLAPSTLRLLPLYILALLKYVAFRTGQSTRLDDRVFAMCQMKSLPLAYLIQTIYPDLYPIHTLDRQPEMEVEGRTVPFPPRLHLSAERLDSSGAFLMDDHASIIIYVGHNISNDLCQNLFDVPCFAAIPQDMFCVPEVDSAESLRLRSFIAYLQSEKPYAPTVQIIREDSHHRMRFLGRLIEDKTESGHSYYEFLQRIKTLVK